MRRTLSGFKGSGNAGLSNAGFVAQGLIDLYENLLFFGNEAGGDTPEPVPAHVVADMIAYYLPVFQAAGLVLDNFEEDDE